MRVGGLVVVTLVTLPAVASWLADRAHEWSLQLARFKAGRFNLYLFSLCCRRQPKVPLTWKGPIRA